MPKMTTFSEYDGLGLAELVAKKAVTPGELVDAAIDRIEDHNPTLNAVVYRPSTRPAAARPSRCRTALSRACRS